MQDMVAAPPPTPPSTDEHKGDPGLMSDFLCGVIDGDFSSDGVHVSSRGATYFLPNAQLQSFLESLNFVNVVKSDPQVIGDLLRSSLPLVHTPRVRLSSFMRTYSYRRVQRVKLHNNAVELQRRGFVTWTTIKSLSIDWNAVSISITPVGYGIQHVDVDELVGRFQISHAVISTQFSQRRHLEVLKPFIEITQWCTDFVTT